MQSSETIGALAEALATVQGEIEGAVKGAVNPHFRSRYADLATVWEAWQSVGPKHGLAIVQMPGACNGGVELTTRLMHKSGEWIERTAVIPLGKNDAQGYGSALTYARRYALAAFVGIAPEDDDGEAAVGRGADKPKPARQTKEDKAASAAMNTNEDEVRGWKTWAAGIAASVDQRDAEALMALQRSTEFVRGMEILDVHAPGYSERLRAKLIDRADALRAVAA